MRALQVIAEMMETSRSATASAIGTTGTGLATALDFLPWAMGIFASTVGIVVTLILFFKQRRKLDLEIAKLEAETPRTAS